MRPAPLNEAGGHDSDVAGADGYHCVCRDGFERSATHFGQPSRAGIGPGGEKFLGRRGRVHGLEDVEGQRRLRLQSVGGDRRVGALDGRATSTVSYGNFANGTDLQFPQIVPVRRRNPSATSVDGPVSEHGDESISEVRVQPRISHASSSLQYRILGWVLVVVARNDPRGLYERAPHQPVNLARVLRTTKCATDI